MPLISLGECNKKMIYPLIGGLGKLLVNIILHLFKDSSKLNNHPFLLGINAGFGLSFAIIPFLYIRKHTKTSAIENLNNTNKTDDIYVDHLFKRNDPIVKKEKYLLIFLCAFLYFIEETLVFIFSYKLETNFWIFNIVFLNVFTSLITKNQIYKHQYFSSGIMVLFGIGLNIINLYKIKAEDIPFLLLSMLIEIIFSLCIVLAKYGMDKLFCSPFEITFYEGIFCFIFNIILLFISTNISISTEKISLFSDLFKLSEYNGKNYLDNFYTYIEEFNYLEVLLFIVHMFGRLIFNLFSLITIKNFTSSHAFIPLLLGEISIDWKNEKKIEQIIQVVIFVVELFMILIFCEIIELNFCGFEKNTRKNIKQRAEIAFFDECIDTFDDFGDGIELGSEKSSSFNKSNEETL